MTEKGGSIQRELLPLRLCLSEGKGWVRTPLGCKAKGGIFILRDGEEEVGIYVDECLNLTVFLNCPKFLLPIRLPLRLSISRNELTIFISTPFQNKKQQKTDTVLLLLLFLPYSVLRPIVSSVFCTVPVPC